MAPDDTPDDTSVNGVIRYIADDEEEEGPLWDGLTRDYDFGDFDDDEDEEDGEESEEDD